VCLGGTTYIQGLLLTEDLKKQTVMYVPGYAEGDKRHPDCIKGTIASWNDTYVFVNYGDGRNIATRPVDLIWC
jgi:hypothetical protein